jgi:hypothetical protein
MIVLISVGSGTDSFQISRASCAKLKDAIDCQRFHIFSGLLLAIDQRISSENQLNLRLSGLFDSESELHLRRLIELDSTGKYDGLAQIRLPWLWR